MKNDRLKSIEDLIVQYEIDTQEELTEKLIALGYKVSQATVSRDINRLNLIKGPGSTKKFKYVKQEQADSVYSLTMVSLFRQVVQSIISAQNIVIVKTLSGNANTAANAIDAMHISQNLGSVAGDDTIIIVTKNNQEANKVVSILRSL